MQSEHLRVWGKKISSLKLIRAIKKKAMKSNWLYNESLKDCILFLKRKGLRWSSKATVVDSFLRSMTSLPPRSRLGLTYETLCSPCWGGPRSNKTAAGCWWCDDACLAMLVLIRVHRYCTWERLLSCCPLFGSCLVFSGTIEARMRESFRSDLAHVNWVICPKCVVSSVIGTHHPHPLTDNQGLHR